MRTHEFNEPPRISVSSDKKKGINERLSLKLKEPDMKQTYHMKTESNITNSNTTSTHLNSMVSPYNDKKSSFRYSINVTSPNRVGFDSLKTCPNLKQFKYENSLFRRVSTKKAERIPGPFEVTEDDKIFNELKKPKKISLKKKSKDKTYKNINQQILSRIYQIPHKTAKRIEKVKRNKNNYPLAKYQKDLLSTVSIHLSKDAVKNLSRAFMRIWNMCNSKIYEKNYDSLKELEEYEEIIIARFHRHENALKNVLINSNDNDMRQKLFNLPKVTFTKVFK